MYFNRKNASQNSVLFFLDFKGIPEPSLIYVEDLMSDENCMILKAEVPQTSSHHGKFHQETPCTEAIGLCKRRIGKFLPYPLVHKTFSIWIFQLHT